MKIEQNIIKIYETFIFAQWKNTRDIAPLWQLVVTKFRWDVKIIAHFHNFYICQLVFIKFRRDVKQISTYNLTL